MVWLDSSAVGKIDLTLLTKNIALHVGPTIVNVRGFGLEFVSKSNFEGIEECVDDSVQVLLAVLVGARILRSRK